MDNTIDNISFIKEENNFNFNENSPKLNKKEYVNYNSSNKLNKNEFNFEKSLDLSNINPNNEEIKLKREDEKENYNKDMNSLDYSFISQNINILGEANINKANKNIKKLRTMPIKKIKKEDLDKIPLPIFSCIYCSNEIISFNHLSNDIISNKYLLQTSILDIRQLDYLISSQPKIEKDNINNILLNIVVNNSEYIKSFYKMNGIRNYFKLKSFETKCKINEIMFKKALKQRLEDIIMKKKKDFYFKEIKGMNKIPKTSINNKCLFNSTNSLINNYSGLNGFIGNGILIPHLQFEKNNNTNQSNSSLYYNSISMNNNKNEIGLVGKGNNLHYMENIMEKTNRNNEDENSIEEGEKEEILDFLGDNDLKRKITKNDIDWENNYYDVYNPIIEDNIHENIYYKNEYESMKKKKNSNKTKNLFQTIENIKSINYINTFSNNFIYNSKLPIFNNSKSLGSTNTSSNIILKNSERDKENKSSLSLFLNGNKIVNLQNNNSTINPSSCNVNKKNKLVSMSLINKKNEHKLNNSNRTPSFTKTRIIDLCTNSAKKLNNHGRSSIDLKNINKKILFNYTANIKKELIDNNITLKIKNAFHNNKRNNIINNKNLIPILNNNININNNTENEIRNNYNKYNILLSKPNINNENLNNKTFFNKIAKGLKSDKDNKKPNYNLNLLFGVKINVENNILKRHIYKKKPTPILNNNKLININHLENIKYYNTIRTKDLYVNLRSMDKKSDRKKNCYIRKNHKSAKKVNISIPQKLLYGSIGIQDLKNKSKNSIRKEGVFIGKN